MGRPPFLTVRWPLPRVSPLTPQITISFTWQRYNFLYRHRVGWFSRPLSWARGHPDGNPSFVPPFRGFRLAGRFWPIFVSRRADAAVGNQHPLGNCVRCVLETGLHLLDSVIRSPKVTQTGLLPQLPRFIGFTEVSLTRSSAFCNQLRAASSRTFARMFRP